MLKSHTETEMTLLRTLNIPYFIINDDEYIYLFITQDSFKDFLTQRQDELIADAESLQAQADRLNLLPDWNKLRELLRAHPLEEREWDYQFELCTRCSEPAPHAYLCTTEGKMIANTPPIFSIFDAIVRLHFFRQDFVVNMDELIHLLKQAEELIPSNEP